MDKPTHCLIDGDVLRYSLGAISSEGYKIDRGTIIDPDGNPTKGIEYDNDIMGGNGRSIPWDKYRITTLVQEKIESIVRGSGCRTFTVYLSEGRNFRYKRATTNPYKQSRAGAFKPYNWARIGDALRELPCISTSEFEADDELAAAQYRALQSGYTTTVIATVDKDLRMVTGWHYKWANGENQPERELDWVDEDSGRHWFWTQMLTGDYSTDGIIGCARLEEYTGKSGRYIGQLRTRRKGIGPKAAEQLLHTEHPDEWNETVVEQYKLMFGDEAKDKFLEMADLLWMCVRMIPFSEDPECEKLYKGLI
jgi:hypothetical protein